MHLRTCSRPVYRINMFKLKLIVVVVAFGFQAISCCSDHENATAYTTVTAEVPTRRVLLHNRGPGEYYLASYADGKVRGETNNSKNAIFEIKDIRKNNIVTISGLESGRHICVNKRKRVKGFKLYRKTRCDFEEIMFGNKSVYYKSLSCYPCYLRIKSNGKVGRIISNLPYTIKLLYKYEKFSHEDPPSNELLDVGKP